jgi:UDP-glucose 4-epimerase
MRILVTGGAGFIGSHLVDCFLASGHEVAVIDNLSSGFKANVPKGVSLHELDVRDPAVEKVLIGFRPDVLCHHAAQLDVRKSVSDPMFDADVNIVGTLRLLEFCRHHGTSRVLFASTGGAIYGEQDVFPAPETHPERPISPYGVAKLSVERYLDFYRVQYGIKSTCMRYANVYGPRQNAKGEAGVVAIFADFLLRNTTPTIFGTGEQTRDFVYVKDVARANLAALKHDLVGPYNVGTGVETNVNQLYAKMAQAFGSSLKPKYDTARPGEQMRSCLDASKLARETDWKIEVSIEQGLKETCEYFKARA